MKINLEGKVVLVTGGASGMGRASAVAFARASAKGRDLRRQRSGR